MPLIKRIALPIDPVLPKIVESLEAQPNLVLRAAPGSGKTTRVPPALLLARFAAHREILVLEPRRLAAKYSARRVAEELGEPVGKTAGYQFRFESVVSPATRLRFLTEGMLIRRILHDADLKNVAAVLLDEFHERHLHTDMALAYLRHLQNTRRPELRLIVMSATLDTGAIGEFLGGCPVIEIENRPYPVEIRHLAQPSTRYLELQVRDAVLKLAASEDCTGDILVFLPGMGEIRRAEKALEGERDLLVLPLHGELSREEQDLAIRKAARRKVILSTNVAETSLTIEGVTGVIDSGLHRIASYSWWSGVPTLRTRPISRASATQRAGRAGRTAPGICVRLYTEHEYESRAAFEIPELRRADLTQALLELKTAGVADLKTLRWFEAPAPASLQASCELLYRLGALEAAAPEAKLTRLGASLAALPAHPRLGRFLAEASRLGVLEDAASLAALIGEGWLENLDALDAIRTFSGAGESVRKARAHLMNGLKDLALPPSTAKFADRDERLRFALLTGFPDRVARKRKLAAQVNRGRPNSDNTELVFSSGGSAQVENAGVIHNDDLFVVLDLLETQHAGQNRTNLRVRSVSPIREEWLIDLEPTALTEKDEIYYSPERGKVLKVSRLVYDSLILSESIAPAPPSPEATRVLLRAALGIDIGALAGLGIPDWILALAKLGEAGRIESAFARAALLQKYFPEQSEETPIALARLADAIVARGSLDEIRQADWSHEIVAAFCLDPSLFSRLDGWLPETLALPNGRRPTIHYCLDKPPWVESRLQDFFGMKRAPTLLDGKLPLTIHLLAPNLRAVQVTTDLAGFWQRGYPELRNALSRRYPRHSWPENPLEAEPPPLRKR